MRRGAPPHYGAAIRRPAVRFASRRFTTAAQSSPASASPLRRQLRFIRRFAAPGWLLSAFCARAWHFRPHTPALLAPGLALLPVSDSLHSLRCYFAAIRAAISLHWHSGHSTFQLGYSRFAVSAIRFNTIGIAAVALFGDCIVPYCAYYLFISGSPLLFQASAA